jgi:hypothetical protein
MTAPPDDDRPYSLDDLVAHEKRQTRFLLLLMLAAMLYFAGKTLLGSREAAPGADVAPVESRR